MSESSDIIRELRAKFPQAVLTVQDAADGIPTVWVSGDRIEPVLRYLKREVRDPYPMLYDLFGIDERERAHREGQPEADFTVVYHLLSFDRNSDVRVKAPLNGESPSIGTITGLWPSAEWYECELWDMFGVRVEGHPHLRRILTPRYWKGHPLRKEHPARATEMEGYEQTDESLTEEEEALRFVPEEWGMKREGPDTEFMFLNIGPHHPGTHGLLRLVLQLDGEEIVDMVPDIGFHHRGAEKMAERQTWHTFIPYTDRIDYLGGVMNNLPYCLAVEQLAGIEVPPRARVIRVMLCELFRIASHLVWYGTFGGDVGAMSPVFYMFYDRERVFDIIRAICGGRMHPNWFRIGGVAQDLPKGWDAMVRELLDFLPDRLADYDRIVLHNRIFQERTREVGAYSLKDAIEWGVTGPGLRACGLEWDFRKKRPYSGYDQFEFDIPTAEAGDCYARSIVRVEEMRQSMRIVRQCLDNMPEGPVKSDHPLTTPPDKERTLHDIETLITHFLSVTWGPVMPPGESFFGIEATKGANGYHLISDGGVSPYRARIRTPSFAHIQMTPFIVRGEMVADLLAILGAVDYVLADVDR